MKYIIVAIIALCCTCAMCGYYEGEIQQRGKYDALVRNSDWLTVVTSEAEYQQGIVYGKPVSK